MALFTAGQGLTAAQLNGLDSRITALSNTVGAMLRGTFAGTTGASGQLTVNHGFGAAPSFLWFGKNSLGNTIYAFYPIGITATQVTIQTFNPTTGNIGVTGQSISVPYIAFL
jgi:hypothetical protein